MKDLRKIFRILKNQARPKIPDGAVLFYDERSGRYFESFVEKVVMDDGLECYIIKHPDVGNRSK